MAGLRASLALALALSAAVHGLRLTADDQPNVTAGVAHDQPYFTALDHEASVAEKQHRSSTGARLAWLAFYADNSAHMTAIEEMAMAGGGVPQAAMSMWQIFLVPLACIAVGGALVNLKAWRLPAQLLLFFGAQTFMNLYMKTVLSSSVVRRSPLMKGFQAPLLLTAAQQLISFVILLVALLVMRLAGFQYVPKVATTRKEWFAIMLLAVTFSGNIALNNFSLSYLDVSMNIIIRSTSPGWSLLTQLLVRSYFPNVMNELAPAKLALLFSGAGSVALTVLCKTHGSGAERNPYFALGISLCICGLLSSVLELVIVKIVGETTKMNAFEFILHMSVPVALVLAAPIFLIQHGVAYDQHAPSTDWQVFMEVARLSPLTIALVFLSGLFALGYNALNYALVGEFSPFFVTFAANFNKVGLIVVALVFGIEHLPEGYWGPLMVCFILGAMGSFALHASLGKS